MDVDVQARANVGIPDREGIHVNTSCAHQGTPVGTSPAHKDAPVDTSPAHKDAHADK